MDGFALHVEVCEDVWTPIPPSSWAAMAGATVLANLSASNITVGKAEYRRDLCSSQSGRCVAAYLYSAAGPGESTTDLAWDGHALIYENSDLLAESGRFLPEEHMIVADVDLERLMQDRSRLTFFHENVSDYQEKVASIRRIPFEFEVPEGAIPLRRDVGRFPYVPDDPAQRDARCYEAYNIQVHGLMKRLSATGIEKIVIGVSGGLDSTHALIVAARTMDRAGAAADEHPRLHHARLRDEPGDEIQRVGADAGAGRDGAGDRHPPVVPADAASDIGHPFGEGRAGVRRDVRERAGGGAHRATSFAWRTCTAASCWGRAT